MHCKGTAKNLSQPKLQYFQNENEGYFNKQSQKTGTRLNHKDTFYAYEATFIFLSKDYLIRGTFFVQRSFAQFGLEVHLGNRTKNSKSKTVAIYFPSHSNSKEKILEELVSGDFDIPGNRFESFTSKFKYLGTYLSQLLTDDIDIKARILAATKNFSTLGKTIFRNQKINLEIRSCLYLATTVDILLWGRDSWALRESHLTKLSTFHHKCIRQLCGYTMYHVREHHIKIKKYMEKTNLALIETYITIWQLRFLSRIAKMDKKRLTRQIINSQAIPKGNVPDASKGQNTHTEML